MRRCAYKILSARLNEDGDDARRLCVDCILRGCFAFANPAGILLVTVFLKTVNGYRAAFVVLIIRRAYDYKKSILEVLYLRYLPI